VDVVQIRRLTDWWNRGGDSHEVEIRIYGAGMLLTLFSPGPLKNPPVVDDVSIRLVNNEERVYEVQFKDECTVTCTIRDNDRLMEPFVEWTKLPIETK
jgi:hypothetical protein